MWVSSSVSCVAQGREQFACFLRVFGLHTEEGPVIALDIHTRRTGAHLTACICVCISGNEIRVCLCASVHVGAHRLRLSSGHTSSPVMSPLSKLTLIESNAHVRKQNARLRNNTQDDTSASEFFGPRWLRLTLIAP